MIEQQTRTSNGFIMFSKYNFIKEFEKYADSGEKGKIAELIADSFKEQEKNLLNRLVTKEEFYIQMDNLNKNIDFKIDKLDSKLSADIAKLNVHMIEREVVIEEKLGKMQKEIGGMQKEMGNMYKSIISHLRWCFMFFGAIIFPVIGALINNYLM